MAILARKKRKRSVSSQRNLSRWSVIVCLLLIVINFETATKFQSQEGADSTTVRKDTIDSSSTLSESRFLIHNGPTNVQVEAGDYIMLSRSNAAPIVVEKYKLVLFTIQKTGCTVWKQLARKMMGYEDWRTGPTWGKGKTGLTYMYHYNVSYATKIMNDPTYTRAVSVRDPKARFVSAYLDKAVKTDYFYDRFCKSRKPQAKRLECHERSKNFTEFVSMSIKCRDTHWGLQSRHVEDKYVPTLDFVGHLETAATDAKALLERIGAWEEHGKTGWGMYGNESIFESTSFVQHKTAEEGARSSYARLAEYFTPELESQIEERFAQDYARKEYNLPLKKIPFDSLS